MNSDNTNEHENGLPVIGWREWVGLPDLGIPAVKVKVDTGARSSSLHAMNVVEFDKEDEKWVRFAVQPVQRDDDVVVETEARVLEYRTVRSSSGRAERRPVIQTKIKLLDMVWPVELTLSNRRKMGFRMLLGREAFRKRFLIDAGASFFGGKPKRRKQREV